MADRHGRQPEAAAAHPGHISGRDEKGQAIEVKDPLSTRLAALWRDDPAQTVVGFLGLAEVFPPALRDDAGFAADLSAALSRLVRDGARATAADRVSA
jgi:fructuronate reductase